MTSVSLENSWNPVGLSREDILKFPFPYKLWITINLPSASFLYWSADGTVIHIALARLQEYLHSSFSIFIIKTSATFLKHLEDFQFIRLQDVETENAFAVVELSYQHKDFQRYRLDLVSKIRRVTFFNLDNAQTAELEPSATTSTNLSAERMRGDLCFMEHGVLTEMQKKRIQSETVYSFARENKVLQEKLKKSDGNGNVGFSCRRGRSACLEREQIVVLPKEIYENPYDSVLAGKGGFQGYRYGGYYGNCTVEQIDKFFGDHLPKYGEGGILKVKNFKKNMEESSQTVKSERAGEKDSGFPVDDLTMLDKSKTIKTEHFMEVEDSSNINISAAFNCNIGAMEYNISDCSNDAILLPPFESLNVIPVNTVTDMNLPITQVVTTTEPSRQQDENTEFYDDLRATFELLQSQSF